MTPINDRIRFPQVRVLDENNEQLGIMQTRDAIGMAQDRGYDLILVAPQAQPPVCRIMDYGKFKYEKSKRDKEKKNKNAANELKMVRLHPRTGIHDREILVKHSERFLRSGHKVRVVCQFKGRENAYPQLGRDQLDAVARGVDEVATVEGEIVKQGRDMTMMLTPRPGVKPLPRKTQIESLLEAADEADAERAADAELAAIQKRVDEEFGADDDDLDADSDETYEDDDVADADDDELSDDELADDESSDSAPETV